MNKWINKLSAIAASPVRTILGVMSGTSMDGLDLALCKIRGSGTSVQLEVSHTAVIEVKQELKTVFEKIAFRREAPAAEILRFQAKLGEQWCQQIGRQIQKWNLSAGEIDLLGSHGQTILHHPDRASSFHGTWQLVDGDLLARRLGIPVVSDYRQKYIAAGYEGAPLAPLAEILLFSDSTESRILLNLGGIANFTILERGQMEPVIPFATDCGPANTLMDNATRRLNPGTRYDEEGRMARSGRVDDDLLGKLMRHPFLSRPFPKSTGQEDFNWNWLNEILVKAGPELKINDLLATLAEYSARTTSMAIRENTDSEEYTIYVSGGGAHNSYLMDRLRFLLGGYRIRSSRELGIDPDAKEAALFAVLANEMIAGNGWADRNGCAFTLGKISIPE